MKYLLLGITLFLFFLFSVNQVFAAQILINEFVANANSGENEWVEFYNPDAIDISSYWIDDDANFSVDSGNSTKRSISSVDTSNSNFPVFTLSSAIFNNTCDTACDYVVLFSSDGSTIDQYQYTSDQISQKGKSIGRSPDGSSNWVILASITKGSSNSTSEPTATPTPVPSPTNTPTPTTAPTATKTPTPTPIKTPTPTPKSSSTGGAGATATPKPTLPPTSAPTKILALSSQAAGGSGNIKNSTSPIATSSPTPTKEPTKKPTPTIATAVLGVAQSNLSKILIGAGVIFLLACGILAFRNFKREKIS